MDREISKKEQNKGIQRGYIKYAIIAGLLVALLFAFKSILKKKVDKDKFFIATVTQGDVMNTITASGRVVPAFEREINAPVATEIAEVVKNTGEEVNHNDLILKLDQEYTRLQFEQLQDELELRKNSIEKLKLLFDKDLNDLAFRNKIKALQLEELTAQVSDQKRLNSIGGATAEELEKAELQLKVSQYEKQMLENELAYKKSSNVAEKKGLELEYTIQEKKLKELRRKLSETDVRSPLKGVITWINEDIGKTVQQGEPLVKIADLNRYKIEATTSDRYANQLIDGMEAEIKIGKTILKGHITRILPEVLNNTIKFIIELEDNNNAQLRSNMRSEISLITDQKTNVLRVNNGQALRGAGVQFVFRVKGDKAYKTKIEKGLSNTDYVEIISGIALGDKIIISNVDDYEHFDEITLVNSNK